VTADAPSEPRGPRRKAVALCVLALLVAGAATVWFVAHRDAGEENGEKGTPDAREPAPTPPLVSYELLKRAFRRVSETSAKMDDVPPEIMALDGKRVRVHGFLGLPSLAEEEIELIFLYAQPYNGCCLGEPPEFFDCVEVKRRDGKLIKLPKGLAYHETDFEIEVTATGIFRVKKVLYEGALLQMYFLDAEGVEMAEEVNYD